MAFDTTKFFTVMGKYIKHTNLVATWISDIATDETQVETAFADSAIDDQTDDMPDLFDSFQQDVSDWVTGTLREREDDVVLDQTLTISELAISVSPSPRNVFEAIHGYMTDNSQTLLERDAGSSINSVTYDTTNANSFKVVYVTTLDGVTNPHSDIPSFVSWNATKTPFFLVRDIKIICIADSESGNLNRGNEVFQVEYGIENGPYQEIGEGAGTITMSVMNNQSITPQGNFNTFDADGNPIGWIIVAGTPGVTFDEGAGLRETSCLVLKAGQTNFLTSDITANVTRRKSYMLVAIAKCATIGTGAGSVILADDSGALASIDLTGAGTNWTLLSTTVTIGAEVDGTPFLSVLNGLSFTADYFIDDVLLIPIPYFGGVGIVPLALDEKILLGDNGVSSVSADTSGVIATFLEKQYRFSLPMVSAGNTISDSLAT